MLRSGLVVGVIVLVLSAAPVWAADFNYLVGRGAQDITGPA